MYGSTNMFALRSRRIVSEDDVVDGCVLVRAGTVEDVTIGPGLPADVPVEDVGASVVMSGLVDTHVHINEPGRTEWEGFETATRAAAAGGVTTLIDMPLNCIPATTTCAALEQKVRAAAGKLHVDCGFYGGVVPGNEGELLALAAAGVFGFKAFLIDSGVPEFGAVGEGHLRASMPVIATTGLPLLVHAEIPTTAPPPPGKPASYRAYLASRPRAWENDAIARMLALEREYSCPIHIVHLSSSEALALLSRARAEGRDVTVETCPHYLFFAAEKIDDGSTLHKCAPPIRDDANREQLWSAVVDGAIDYVATDHSPAPPALKRLDTGSFFDAWGGIASLQQGLSATWTAGRQRGITIDRLASLMSKGPARRAGLLASKGGLHRGADADIVVWNPEVSFEVTRDSLFQRHKRTPYEGHRLFGVVEKTFLRGELVYADGTVVGGPRGRILRRGRA